MKLSIGLKKANVSLLVFVIELFVLIPCGYVRNITILSVAAKYIRLIILAWEICKLIAKRFYVVNNRKIPENFSVSVILIFFAIIQFLVTLERNSSIVMSSFNDAVAVISLVMFLHRKLNENYLNACKAICLYTFLIVAINAAALVIFPYGLYVENLHESASTLHICYFLGVSNQYASYILPLASIFYFYEFAINKKRMTFSKTLFMILALFNIIYDFSATGCVLIIGMIILANLYRSAIISKLMDIRVLLIVYIFVYVGVVIIQFSLSELPLISSFVENILAKNLTFSKRIYLWQIAIQMIIKQPIFGYGKVAGDGLVHYGNTTFSAHNVFLHVTLESGIISTILFISSIIISMRKLVKENNAIKVTDNINVIDLKTEKIENFSDENLVRILYIGVFFTLLYFIFENCKLYPFITLLMVAVEYNSFFE